MIRSVFILVVVCVSWECFTQPQILWRNTFGGSSYDVGSCVLETQDGGYIVAGHSSSQDGDIFGSRGGVDFWILKFNKLGGVQWKKNLGGSENDWGTKVIQTTDEGYLIVGYAGSTDFDVSGNHGGLYDGWVVKLSSTGTIEWQKCIGGSEIDLLWSAKQTLDGAYILSGYSNSDDGDISGNQGDFDAILIKLSQDGEIEWQKSLGGSSEDNANSVIETPDGGFVIIGETWSDDEDVLKLHEGSDLWVVKVTEAGEIEWNTTLGGSGADFGIDAVLTQDNGYVVLGFIGGDSGDISVHHGAFDYWVVKLSQLGELIWEKSLGGSGPDWARSLVLTKDNSYLIAGESASNDGDVVNLNGGLEIWLSKVNDQGSLIWQKSFGGSKADACYSIGLTNDGGYILTGATSSNNGDFSGCENGGEDDLFIMKFAPESSAVSLHYNSPLSIAPNPASTSISLQGLETENEVNVIISNFLGQTILQKQMSPDEQINVGNLPKGIYLVSAIGENNKTYLGKFEKL